MNENTRLAQMIIRLFSHWQLSIEDQTALLGVDPDKLAEELGESMDLQVRVGHLLGIHKCLRLLYPKNRDFVYSWVSRPNRQFDNNPPLEVMKKGTHGCEAIHRYLEFQCFR